MNRTTVSQTSNKSRKRQRQLDEVERRSDTECTLLTSLDTKETGSDTAEGIIFTLNPKRNIDLLTLEFHVSENGDKIPNVQVYYRSGEGFTEAINQPSEWQELANADAQIIPGLRPKAIIPVSEFTPVTLESGTVHALYVAFPQASTVKVKNVGDDDIGNRANNDDVVDIQTGVSLNNAESFSGSYASASQFNGILHYSLTSECQTIQTDTDVKIAFAIDSEPSDGVTDGLAGAVESAVLDYMNDNPILAEFQEFYYLNLEDAKTSFQGRSQKCPEEYKVCSLFVTTLTMSHSPALASGELQLGILGGSKAIEKSVTSQSPVDLIYAGDDLVTLDFLITLFNTPEGDDMNPIQRRYFESVTMDLLKEAPGPPIYSAMVLDEILGDDWRRRLSLPFLRGRSSRVLQPGGKIQILTQVISSGTISEVKNAVLTTLGDDDSTYHTELVTQRLDPGEINEQDFGDFFADINLLHVQVKPADFPNEQNEPKNVSPSRTNGADGNTTSFSIWVVVCLVLIVMSLVTIMYRIFKDCCSSPPKQKSRSEILQDVHATDSGTADHMDSNDEIDDDDVQSVSIADLSAGDQESDDGGSSTDLKDIECIKVQLAAAKDSEGVARVNAVGEAADNDSGSESESESDSVVEEDTIDGDANSDSESGSDSKSLDEASELSASELNESESEDSELISRADFESPKPRRVQKENETKSEVDESKENGSEDSYSSEDSDDETSSSAVDKQERSNLEANKSNLAEKATRRQLVEQSMSRILVELDSDSEDDETTQKPVDNSGAESDEESSLSSFEVQDDEESGASLSDNQSAANSSQESEGSKACESDDDTSVDPLDIEDENVEESCRHIAPAPAAIKKAKSLDKGQPKTSASQHSRGALSLSSNSTHSTSQRSTANRNLGTPRNKSGVNGRGIQASRSMPVAQRGPPKKQPPFNSQHNRSPGSLKNKSGMKGRDIVPSRSMPAQSGAPARKQPPPRKVFTSTLQHSRGIPARKPSEGPRNQSGATGRGVQPSRSMPTVPMKHLPRNSNHSAGGPSIGRGSNHNRPQNLSGNNGRKVMKTSSMPTKKLTPLQASRSNKASTQKTVSKNQSGMNGRGVAGSRSMPMGNGRKPPPRKISVLPSNDEESEASSITAGNYPKRPASTMAVPARSSLKGSTPQRKITRSHSAEGSLHQFGKAGKIKFQPRPKPQPTLVKMK